MSERGNLHLELLGPMRLWRRGAEIPLGPPKQRAVLGVLAGSLGEVLTVEQLADGVWGHRLPRSAASAVHTYVAGLRRALEPGRRRRESGSVLASADGGYSLRMPAEAIDARLFTRRVNAAHALLAAGRSDAAAVELERGLSLWHGDAYANVPGPGAEIERARLARTRMAAVEEWAELLLAAGLHNQVVPALVGYVGREPLRERLRFLLMVALYRSGRRAHALGVYRETTEVLDAELGVEPGPELRELYEQILDGHPVLLPGTVHGSVEVLRTIGGTVNRAADAAPPPPTPAAAPARPAPVRH
ncbi:MAG: AfsR/SARP family transcriptional regulator [Streptomyces sp.]|nr:AfsR/SARP family transcriptional regulator [Streptomyces sp.]